MITVDILRQIAPNGKSGLLQKLAPALTDAIGSWTSLEQAHFLAQAAHETMGFQTLEELGGPNYWKRYEGRKDLGNVKPGDGVKYHGRGIFQLTGRTNYYAYGKKLGLDLIDRPELAADPATSVIIAVSYWKAKGLGAWAQRDDVEQITRKINGGLNGFADRKKYLAKAKKALEARVAVPTAVPKEEVPDAPIAAEPAKRWWESTTVLASVGAAASGIGAAVKGAVVDIDTPWEVAGLALFVIPIIGCAFWIIRERMRREPK